MSELKVDKISPVQGTSLILGDVGDTIAFPQNAIDPATDTNPAGGVGSMWLNTTSGNMFTLTDATEDANIWKNVGGGVGDVAFDNGIVAASGGTITTDGDYKVHTFNSSSQFVVTDSGIVDYLVIAGGGGGAATVYGPGGGGAGGYRNSYNSEISGGGGSSETELTLDADTYTVTIGAGGAVVQSVTNIGNVGSDSVFGSVTSVGGGYGAGVNIEGGIGGSGGGGDGEYSKLGGTGTSNQGFGGGDGGARGSAASENYQGGGGGGAGSVGADGLADGSNSGGGGGAGATSSISGSSVIRAGGGGGSVYNTNNGASVGGIGGSGGGGAGGIGTGTAGTNATVNTGSGGGGSTSNPSGAGGSGIVIIRYQFQ